MAGAKEDKVREAGSLDAPCPLHTPQPVPKVVLMNLRLTSVMCLNKVYYLDLPLAKIVFPFSYEKLKEKDGHSMVGFHAKEKVY